MQRGEYDPSTTYDDTPAQGDGPSNRDGKEIAMLIYKLMDNSIAKIEMQQIHPTGAVYLWLSY